MLLTVALVSHLSNKHKFLFYSHPVCPVKGHGGHTAADLSVEVPGTQSTTMAARCHHLHNPIKVLRAGDVQVCACDEAEIGSACSNFEKQQVEPWQRTRRFVHVDSRQR